MLGLSWSTLYYRPVGPSLLDQAMMAKLDEKYTAAPFYGVRRMTKYLAEDEGFVVGRDHVRTLLRRMGLTARISVWRKGSRT